MLDSPFLSSFFLDPATLLTVCVYMYQIILYLSYFYKHGELSVRLGFWWTAMSIADIIASFLGFGLLHLRGHHGRAGWRWLFLVEVWLYYFMFFSFEKKGLLLTIYRL